ncbi:MAG: DUF5683 domain-containing protein [Daejeonella sp.]
MVNVFAQKTDTIPLNADTTKKNIPPPVQAKVTPFKDSLRLEIEKRPRKAAIRSAIVPGLGQIYNKRWWKVPLIYGGFVGIGLVYEFNHRNYKIFLKEAQFREANPGMTENPLYVGASNSGIILVKDAYRRNRDLSVLIGVAFYAVNIIDAYIDAKFLRFDISNDLSLNIRPSLQQAFTNSYTSSVPSIKLSLSF